MLTDIDIDVATSKDSEDFRAFYKELQPHISQSLENFVDENYDNYNFELTFNGQIIDICPMDDLKLFSKATNKYEQFYKEGFPDIKTINFEGFDLPLLSKEAIIENKEMLSKKDQWQQRDIDELRKLLN